MNNITLSEEQQIIVDSTANNIIVAAGAGSGKTRVLTERVRKLLLSGINPKSVVVITFTNMAAEELQARLKDVPNIDKCFIGTIHSLANTLLSSKYNYDLYTEDTQDYYMKFLINHFAQYATIDDYEKLLDEFYKVSIGTLNYYSVVKMFKPEVFDELLILLGYNQEHNTLCYDDYPQDVLTLCSANHIITFDELLQKCSDYFKQHNTDIEYLFVDELQDIGYLEYEFLMNLNSKHNFFIGDDYQAIYGFKGGNVNIFLSLLENPKYTHYYLEDNYRNGAVILSYANRIISNAANIIPKKSNCKSNRIGSVDIKSKCDFNKFLSMFTEEGYGSFGDWFILVRKNSELEKIAKSLKARNIPTISFRKSEISKEEMDSAMTQNAIKLLTIHTAKGLENENVVLYGNFPLNQKTKTKSDELKIFYVGITRAKEKLLIFNGQ